MYFVDRRKIEEQLVFLERNLSLFKESSFQTDLEKVALERLHHVVIESIIDVGNTIIDGFIMRDPGSYEDIIEILTDECVVPATSSEPLKQVVVMRKILMQDFTNIDHNVLEENLTKNMNVLEAFPNQVRKYLNEELGAVSAFMPEES
ncbi:DUF86 domain-containing protein [Guptibacillus algicola]|uniref:DUF86 domain-containing protein n=1 Tax=Guptibacillus algicola TaxID=225844 RepID=UPI001CD5723D|nr:DUF86 domain-containing protein [Alkalihalobacillus algicola]MCA0986643.1 DUF86 domain-containing protein [Alkalihalobacillus algicola]